MARRVKLSRRGFKYLAKADRQTAHEELNQLEVKLTSLLNGMEDGIHKNLKKLVEDGCLGRLLEQLDRSDGDWTVPKNLLCALLMEEVFQYGPPGLRIAVKSSVDATTEAKRNTVAITDWYHRI